MYAARTIALLSLFVCVARAAAQDPLPPTDSTLAASEAQAKLDDELRSRVLPIEQRIRQLESQFQNAPTPDRVKIVEEKVALLERLNQAERARVLGISRTRYTAGYVLIGDMQTKTRTLKALVTASDAFTAIIDLTDLRQYAGFDGAFNALTDKLKKEERPWLRGLLASALPVFDTGVKTLSTVVPVMQVAGFALDQLKSVVPALARQKFSGNDFVRTYNALACGLQTVSQLQTDFQQLGIANSRLSIRLDSLLVAQPKLLAEFHSAVDAPGGVTREAFYQTVDARFNLAAKSTSNDYLTFVDAIDARNARLVSSTREYHSIVRDHLGYWQQTREILQRRRDATCMKDDSATQARFSAAIAKVNDVIAELTGAYFFDATDRPENEYYREITRGM